MTDFEKLVESMRAWQRHAEKCGARAAREGSRRLEREVDAALARLQERDLPSLFGGDGEAAR